MNPHDTNTTNKLDQTRELLGIDLMTVSSVKSHTLGDDVGHHVKVSHDMFNQEVVAEVLTTQYGDVSIPEKGDRVLVAYRADGRPLVIGSHYPRSKVVPEFQPGERRIGHPASDSFIRLLSGGSVRVEGNDGAVLLLRNDGTVALSDNSGYGIEAQNNGEVHIYGDVKQHTSQTLDL